MLLATTTKELLTGKVKMSGVFAVRWKMRLFVVLALIAASQGELVESRYIILTASPEVCITTEYILLFLQFLPEGIHLSTS